MDYATALRQGLPVSAEEFAAIRQQANQQMTPFTPPQAASGAPQQSSVDRWPGLLNPSQAVQWAAGKLPNMPDISNTSMAKYLRNSVDALGRAPGDVAEMSPGEMFQNTLAASAAFPSGVSSMAGILRNTARNPEVAKAATTGDWAPIKEAARAREVKINTAPPHALQKRGPDGRFQTFDAETRKVRDQAIKDRARQKAPEHKMEYDDFGEPLGSKAARDLLSKI